VVGGGAPNEGTNDEAVALREGFTDAAEVANGGGVGTGVGKAVDGAEAAAKPGKLGLARAENEGADVGGCGLC